jgi:UDP-N-acetylglucosamine 2-epimerase (non-hydrolysing)/GDP/UDP-N,N'-diacetylbacillosamine 2-epimerase (hydrolysing)
MVGEHVRRICVVSGSRSDYGLLVWPMRAIAQTPGLSLQIAVTGMHLSPEFGMTVDGFAEDGFTVDARVETLLSSDSPVGIAKSVGLGIIGFTDALTRLAPDLVLLLGDRFEMFAAAQAALFLRIPMAHLFGGDTTEGAFDEAIRHSITKMAHLHFVSNADAARRVRQLGEAPDRIFTVGSTGIDAILRMELLDRAAAGLSIDFPLRPRNLLITFHPVTLNSRSSVDQFNELLAALASLDTDIGLIFTMPNADTEGRALIGRVRDFVDGHPNACAVTSLGQRRYLSLMRHADAVVGNSSSGLYEAPSFGVPTVDIGDRQKGRLRAASVISAPVERHAIAAAISAALARGRVAVENPYGDGQSSRRIAELLAAIPDYRALIQKPFHDLPEREQP